MFQKVLLVLILNKSASFLIRSPILTTVFHINITKEISFKLEIINFFMDWSNHFRHQKAKLRVQVQICFVPKSVKAINKLGKFLLLSWTYLFILILGRFKVEVYSGANFQIVEPIASVKKCKCQWKDDAWDFVNLRHGIQCLFRIIHSPSDAPLTPQCTVENQTRNSKLI